MSNRVWSFLLTGAVVALSACSGGGGGPVQSHPTATPVVTPSPTPTPSPVTINSTANTDVNAYTLVLDFNGSVTINETNRSTNQPEQQRTGTATAASVTQLYSDLNANLPVSGLSTTTCNKSSSYGTVTTVTYDGSSSNDISCPNSTATQTILNDVRAVTNQFGPYNT